MFTSRRFWFGLGVSAAFLLAVLWRVNFRELLDALSSANYIYVLPAVAVYFLALAFRALRWRFLLQPVRTIPWPRLYPVLAVGYMANNLLPMRLGEIVRSYYLARRESVSASTALATIVVERVFDGLTLLFLLVVAALFLPVAGLAEQVGDALRLPVALVTVAVLVPFLATLALMVAIALRPAVFLRFAFFFIRRLPSRAAVLISRLLERFIEGFQDLHQPRRLAAVFILSLPVWLVEAAVFYLIALGFDLDAHFNTAGLLLATVLMVTALSNLATALPTSQGSVGPFELFVVLTLVFLGVGSGVASAYAVVLHAVLLLPVIGAGLLHLAANSISLGQLATAGKAPARTAPTADGAS